MRGTCAIVLDRDRALISFGYHKRFYPAFLEELEIPISYNGDSILSCLQQNIEILDQRIKEVEKSRSFRVEKVFLELPWGFANKRVVQDSIPLRRRKSIASADISFAKKYLEDKFLDWDDFCLHNIVINYEVEGVSYDLVPLGIRAKKIELQSLLLWVKDKIYKETEDIFDNLDRNFGGFIEPGISMYSCVFLKKEKTQVVVSINYDCSHFVIRNRDGFIFGREFDFGLKKIIEMLAQKFILPLALAEEVFMRYISFKESPYFKEITIKKEEGYINLSTQTLNSFIKDYIKNEISYLLDEIKKMAQDDGLAISFIGRLNSKDGFYGFLKDFIPHDLKAPLQKETISSSFGCLRYGLSPFLEEDYKKNELFLRRIVNIYKEYF